MGVDMLRLLREYFHLDGNSPRGRQTGPGGGLAAWIRAVHWISAFGVFIMWRRHRTQLQNISMQHYPRM